MLKLEFTAWYSHSVHNERIDRSAVILQWVNEAVAENLGHMFSLTTAADDKV